MFPDIMSFTSFCSVEDKHEKNNSSYDTHVEMNMSTNTCFWKLHDISYFTQCQTPCDQLVPSNSHSCLCNYSSCMFKGGEGKL